MGRTGLVVVAGALALAGCGTRTALLLPGDGADGGAGGGPGAVAGGSVVPTGCKAALQPGAPTPIRGFCSTRAGLAPVTAPRAPAVAWVQTIVPNENPADHLPLEIVVDAAGRAILADDASPLAATPTSKLVALDPDGQIAWSLPLPTPVSGLALGPDGSLWGVTQSSSASGTTSQILRVGRDGALEGAITPAITDPTFGVFSWISLALGSDASVYVSAVGGLARVLPGGATLWTRYDGQSSNHLDVPVVLGPDDTTEQGGASISSAGAVTRSWLSEWSALVLAPNGDAVGLDLSQPDPHVLRVDATGSTLLSYSLGNPTFTVAATQLAVAADGTVLVLVADEQTGSAGTRSAHVEVTALDASGAARWKHAKDFPFPFDPSGPAAHFGLFVDPAGTIVVTAGSVFALDLGTGDPLWDIAAPNASACLRPAVLGAGGSVLASQCDGTVFMARDP